MIGTIGGSGFGQINGHKVHLHYELMIEGEYVNPVIDDETLIDPQTMIDPVDLGYLNPAIIKEQRKPMDIVLPNLLLINNQ